MEILFFFKNMTGAEERELRDYFSEKLPQFDRMLKRFDDDAAKLHVRAEKFQKHSAYEVELALTIPRGAFTGCEASHTITKAVDLAKDRLLLQLKKAMGEMREHRSIKARNKEKLREGAPV